MAGVKLGRAGDTVVVDLDVCAKTGRTTNGTVTFRGTTTPGWIAVLLILTVVGYLLAHAMTSRRYVVTLPYTHDVYDRWRMYRRIAWAVALAGVGAIVVGAADSGADSAGVWAVVGLSAIVVAVLGGAVNAWVNSVGFALSRDHELVVTRAHPAFVQAVAGSSVESAPAPR